ncbi:methanogenesis marker protein Mmp4/MtxX [Methanothermococcus okinawensis]|uniref:Methanogen marker protein 4 n=1 Tax=Methanothermococcus okinawensis (strain DSM 14208 / JCM 11175 / IH1) TaxID=647113 RepID=F8AM01_METOI|nr:methanogenesis marker protein Mmp4/MtxX [Methanothermococcus okinawensis]AEH06676.1 methanogen marker protein 4 [Methanothermococcus okinawensis IH1]
MVYLMGIGKTNNEELLKAYHKLIDEGIEVKLVDDPKELISLTVNREVQGSIRGTLSSSEVIPYLKKYIGKFYRASILKNPFTNNYFLLSPVGIDEVDDENGFNDKINIINYAIKFLNNINNTNDNINNNDNNTKCNPYPKIGILSSGRLSDYGRSKKIDKSIDEGENIVKYISNSNKYNAKHTNNLVIKHKGILIEEYLKEGYNIIIAPDGISGNLIFRCLGLVCGIEGCGAVVLNNNNVKFIDTSRNGNWKRYYNAVKFLTGEILNSIK